MKVLENGSTARYKRYYKINIQRRGSAEICLRNAPRGREGTSLVFRMRLSRFHSALSSERILKSKIRESDTFFATRDKVHGDQPCKISGSVLNNRRFGQMWSQIFECSSCNALESVISDQRSHKFDDWSTVILSRFRFKKGKRRVPACFRWERGIWFRLRSLYGDEVSRFTSLMISWHNSRFIDTYYFAESFNWYSLLLPKHSCTPLSDHNLFIAASNSSLKGSVSSILWITSNTIFASVCKHEKAFNALNLTLEISLYRYNRKILSADTFAPIYRTWYS